MQEKPYYKATQEKLNARDYTCWIEDLEILLAFIINGYLRLSRNVGVLLLSIILLLD